MVPCAGYLLFVFLSPLSAVLLDEWVFFFAMFCQCSVTVTMFCNNVSVICYMLVTGYVLLGLLEK